MALGVVCHWLVDVISPRGKLREVNALDERILQLGRWTAGEYSESRVRETHLHNVRSLERLLRLHVGPSGIRCFRVSSNMLPLADRVPRAWVDSAELRSALESCGRAACHLGIRLTTHPGQFCVLSSSRSDVVANAVAEIDHHAWVFDVMGLPASPDAAINVHGGVKGGSDALIAAIPRLSASARARLTLENCETSYDVVQLHRVYQETGVPICWDSHHHTFNAGGLDLPTACALAVSTWPSGVRPLQHLANTEPHLTSGSFSDRRKHSEMIHTVPQCQLDGLLSGTIDVEVEAKKKNKAVLALSARIGTN